MSTRLLLSGGANPTNRATLEREIGDVLAAITLMNDLDFSADAVNAHRESKLLKVRQWLHHQDRVDDEGATP